MVNVHKLRKEFEICKWETYRKAVIFLFIASLTVLSILYYYYPSKKQWYVIQNPRNQSEWQEDFDVQEGFLVYSRSCKIPDFDPYHPSIKHLVETSDPINCLEYAPLTTTRGNVLILNEDVAFSKGIRNFSCCYKAFFRNENAQSDDVNRFSEECKIIHNQTFVTEEFIRVNCKMQNGNVFYINYHSFIQDKLEVERRCNKTKDRYSVLIIGVDAVSRLNMHRQLKNTSSYLLQKMGAIEMYGFNKVGDNTFPNLVPLLLGYDQRELENVCWKFSTQDEPLDKCDFLWNQFKSNGYRTFYAEDTPYISSFNYQKEGFYKQPTDYYFRNFILEFENELGRNKPANCYLCVGSISETEAVLDWTKEFLFHFRDKPYFAFSWINSLTHDYLNMGSSGDHIYKKFFRDLHETGSLNNTIIIFMGDHGMRWGDIRSTFIGHFEAMLPMLLIVLPPKFQTEYAPETRTLKRNAHRLVTPFDLHATLDNILHLKKKPYSLNTTNVPAELRDNFISRARTLFQPISIDRSCQSASIDEPWCTCHMSLAINSNSKEVKSLASFIVNKLNSILKSHKSICAKLNLQSITESRIWHPPSTVSREIENIIYTITIKTIPGEGIFEATARYNALKRKFELLGTISRLNLYRNQSFCVHDAFSKLYCYCKNNIHN